MPGTATSLLVHAGRGRAQPSAHEDGARADIRLGGVLWAPALGDCFYNIQLMRIVAGGAVLVGRAVREASRAQQLPARIGGAFVQANSGL